jgi:hypothetical protein
MGGEAMKGRESELRAVHEFNFHLPEHQKGSMDVLSHENFLALQHGHTPPVLTSDRNIQKGVHNKLTNKSL